MAKIENAWRLNNSTVTMGVLTDYISGWQRGGPRIMAPSAGKIQQANRTGALIEDRG